MSCGWQHSGFLARTSPMFMTIRFNRLEMSHRGGILLAAESFCKIDQDPLYWIFIIA